MKKKLTLYNTRGLSNSHSILRINSKAKCKGQYKVAKIIDEDLSNLDPKNDRILISANQTNHIYETSVWGIADRLLSEGIKDIYVMPATLDRKPLKHFNDYDKEHFITHIDDFTEPEVKKFLASEGCNVNC